ncbi:MAG: hypothetical protein EBU66_07530 [Bacteroidetes bacterium]|nr:hypothetical protein [bacterium]NBP64496.1 hypothetical protein [Bacteroidota bacterium]
MNNVIRGFVLALTLAAAKFFISGDHIGELVFYQWMFFGFIASLFLKFLEAVEIYQKLKKEIDNAN